MNQELSYFDCNRQRNPSKKKNGNRVTSSPHLEYMICQGLMAIRNITIIPKVLPRILFPSIYTNGMVRIPMISMGSLTVVGVNPPNATDGISIYP